MTDTQIIFLLHMGNQCIGYPWQYKTGNLFSHPALSTVESRSSERLSHKTYQSGS